MPDITPKGKPEGLVQSDKTISILSNILSQAYDKVNKTLIRGDYSTRSRRNAIIRQLDEIVESTDGLVRDWVKVSVPNFYEQGMFEATKSLADRGDNITIKSTFNHFHREAIEAISQDTYFHIASGIKGISLKGRQMVDMGTRQSLIEKIATGRITGDSITDIRNEVKKQFREQGITALIDRSGREWDLDRYGEMLARTKLTQAHNSGVTNRMLEAGYDLVQVSGHSGACPLCRPFEFQVLSVSGRNPSFLSLDDARGAGLFHPNCRHIITAYHNRYLDESVIWDTDKQEYRPYKDFIADKFNKPSFDYKTGVKESDIPTNRVYKVYRAEDSKGAGATLGEGKYFAFDKQNVERYGKDIKEYYLDPTAKMLELSTVQKVNEFEDEIKLKYGDRLAELIHKYGAEEANARAITEYAKKLGFNGIISDDEVLGSIVFDPKFLIPTKSKQAKKVAELIISDDLKQYELAFNNEDLRTLERLRGKYPTDSRFKIHMEYTDLKPTTQDFNNILSKHKDAIDELGYSGIDEFNRLLEKGNKTELNKFIANMDNTNLANELKNLLEFM